MPYNGEVTVSVAFSGSGICQPANQPTIATAHTENLRYRERHGNAEEPQKKTRSEVLLKYSATQNEMLDRSVRQTQWRSTYRCIVVYCGLVRSYYSPHRGINIGIAYCRRIRDVLIRNLHLYPNGRKWWQYSSRRIHGYRAKPHTSLIRR